MHYIIVTLIASLTSCCVASSEISVKGYKTECANEACSRYSYTPIEVAQSEPVSNAPVGGLAGLSAASSEDGLIKFNIDCTTPDISNYETPADFCENVKAAFLLSGQYLTSALKLVAPITVNVQTSSFCAKTSSVSTGCSTYIGFGKPSSMWELTNAGLPDVLYPPALARQLFAAKGQSSALSGLPESDIDMFFNTDYPYYFSNEVLQESGAASPFHAIRKGETDFQHVATHELVHGLGMITSFGVDLAESASQLTSVFPAWADKDLSKALTPPVVGSGTQTSFSKITIFDYYLTSSQGSFFDQVQTVKQMLDTSASSDRQLEGLAAAQSLYKQSTTPRAVRFQFSPQPGGFYVYTDSPKFEPASSLDHESDAIYDNTSNFLMTTTAESGVTLSQEVANGGGGGSLGPLGKNTILALGTMGYSLNADIAVMASSSRKVRSDWVWTAPLLVAFFTTMI